MEASTGFEPVKKGFADLCVTIPPRRPEFNDYLIVTASQLFIKLVIVCKMITRYNYCMKECTMCKKLKRTNDFFYRSRRTQKLHSQCKQCYEEKRRKIWKEHYHKYGSNYRENAVARNKKLKNKLRQQMLEYLSDKSCVVCGISDSRVLEFDHLDPALKSFGISSGLTNITKWAKILAEIEKCQILCANCHKIKTAKDRGWYRHIESSK